MKTLFISDLHLDEDRPQITQAFIRFLNSLAPNDTTLYILGDLFEFWIGDDAPLPAYRMVMEAFAAATGNGLPVYFMHGNRDFLIGQEFAAASGCSIIPDPTVIELHGETALLMHGDTLCTDDIEYQQFRHRVRDPQWQQAVLSRPADERLEMARSYREQSIKGMQHKDMAIMDVSAAAVDEALRRHGTRYLIHGHTHRPDIHDLTVDDRQVQRIVLGDWYEQGSVLEFNDQGFELKTLDL